MKLLPIVLLILTLLAAASPARTAEYLVDKGDVLQITVYSHDDMTSTVRIAGNGTIVVPLLGQVAVQGKTIPQISVAITMALADGYIIDPQVNVFITQYRAQNVYVNGQVNKPGVFAFKEGMTMIKVITLAGSFTEHAARNKIQIVRKQDDKDVSLKGVGMDEPILPGDVIVVSERIMIFINGQVKKPNGYQLEPGMTLIKLIAKAGGFTNLAAKNKVRIIRLEKGVETIIRKARFNTPLQFGDVIIVPESFF